MSESSFSERLLNRLRYRLTSDNLERKIININYPRKRIFKRGSLHYIPELNFEISILNFHFILDRFDVFVRLPILLKGHYSIIGGSLLLQFGVFTLRIKTAEELFIIQEIFVEGHYNFVFPDWDNLVVIDVGMNVGFASLFFSAMRNVRKVYSFEPFKDTYDEALANFELNKNISNKIMPQKVGLGIYNERVVSMYNPLLKGKNSALKNRKVISPANQPVEVEIRAAREVVDAIIQQESASQFVMKIDCEGAEYAIFDSLFSHHIPKCIRLIMVERHGDGQRTLLDYLEKENFRIIGRGLATDIGMIYAFNM